MQPLREKRQQKRNGESEVAQTEESSVHALEQRGSHQVKLLRLQRTHGNRFVQRLLSSERDAAEEPESESLAHVHEVLKSEGQPLPSSTQAFFESSFGHDFSQVRLHTDAEAAKSAERLDALAYTVGSDVVFGDGQYAPETSVGKQLLAHELTHVVQQSAGEASGISEKLVVGEPGDIYEQEADRVSGELMREESLSGPESGSGPTVQRQLRDDKGLALQLQKKEPAATAEPEEKEEEEEEDEEEATWDYDPKKYLDAAGVNPQFREAAKAGLAAAVADGLRPRVHEVMRSEKRSDMLHANAPATGHRAAKGGHSLHNYGLAMDVNLIDEDGRTILYPTHPKIWFKSLTRLNSHFAPHNLIWAQELNDAVHWEYHPAFAGFSSGKVSKARRRAMAAAEAVDKANAVAAYATLVSDSAEAALSSLSLDEESDVEPDEETATSAANAATQNSAAATTQTATANAGGKTDWMPYFWFLMGAGGTPIPEIAKEAKKESKKKKKK
jgi:hypothetical protein